MRIPIRVDVALVKANHRRKADQRLLKSTQILNKCVIRAQRVLVKKILSQLIAMSIVLSPLLCVTSFSAHSPKDDNLGTSQNALIKVQTSKTKQSIQSQIKFYPLSQPWTFLVTLQMLLSHREATRFSHPILPKRSAESGRWNYSYKQLAKT